MKKLLFAKLFIIVSLILSISSCGYEPVEQQNNLNDHEYLLFVGNPGVGKSTLINSLVGKKVAESGISPGTGLTKFSQVFEHDGLKYVDTPGLADIRYKKQAGIEIEKSLKKD